jgi:hypothetical protein
MINYHPVGDAYHCCYRLLILTEATKSEVISYDLLRLMDFYFLFPHLLKKISLPNTYKKYRKNFDSIEEPFEVLSSPTRVFYTLSGVQDTAFRSLVARGYFERNAFMEKSEVRLINPLENNITKLFESEGKIKEEWFSAFVEIFLKSEFHGEKGLKARSGLLEYRYDTP